MIIMMIVYMLLTILIQLSQWVILKLKDLKCTKDFNDQGLEKTQFNKFEKVLSGHFHKKSDDGQIYYLGTQYEISMVRL